MGSDWTPHNPSKYKPEFCNQIIKHCRNGGTIEQFASEVGVHKDTLYQWADKHPDFAYAKSRAKQESEILMMDLVHKSIVGKRLGPKGKSRAINWPLLIFYMKARFGWNDQPVEGSEDGDVDFEFE